MGIAVVFDHAIYDGFVFIGSLFHFATLTDSMRGLEAGMIDHYTIKLAPAANHEDIMK